MSEMGDLGIWIVAVVVMAYIFKRIYDDANRQVSKQVSKHPPVTHCTDCGAKVIRFEYTVGTSPYHDVWVVSWFCESCGSRGTYPKSRERKVYGGR